MGIVSLNNRSHIDLHSTQIYAERSTGSFLNILTSQIYERPASLLLLLPGGAGGGAIAGQGSMDNHVHGHRTDRQDA